MRSKNITTSRRAGQPGISTISFSLDDNGKPFAPVVTRSSGYELLDNPQWMLSSELLLSVHRRVQNGG
ncbi:energy transducer TonB [Providencia stuartii]|uniref:energy transducer TonB n=1 Tax=Providencia stuartii TaxID=588 RepID=UPI0034DD5397